jgi:hypothetical protein
MNSLSSYTTHQDKPTKITSQAAGYLLNWPGLPAMASILVLAAWNGQAPIVVPTILGSPRVEYESMLALAIDVLSMSNFHHNHCAFFVLDRVDDAIPPLPHSVTIRASKLFTPWRAWIPCERLDTTEDLFQVFLRDAVEILLNRFFEKEAICGHLF